MFPQSLFSLEDVSFQFVDREQELAQLLAQLQLGKVIVLVGENGIGKTTLASKSLQRLANSGVLSRRFPDGVVYHNFYVQPSIDVAFETIIHTFVDECHTTLIEETKKVLANKEALLFLEGGEVANNLTTLLEVVGHCGVLITSTYPFDEAGEALHLSALPIDEIFTLFPEHLLGGGQQVVQELYDLVGGNTLLLSLISQYLVQQNLNCANYLEWLSKISFENTDSPKTFPNKISTILERHILGLSDLVLSCLRVVGSLAIEPFAIQAIVQVLQVDKASVLESLQELVSYGLVFRVKDEHYVVAHELIHEFISLDLPIQNSTLINLIQYYYAVLKQPKIQDNRPVDVYIHIVAVLKLAVERGIWQETVDLVWEVANYFSDYEYLTKRKRVLNAGILAAQTLGDFDKKSYFLNRLGIVHTTLGHLAQAIRYYKEALSLARNAHNKTNEGASLGNLGIVYGLLGNMDKAISHYKTSLGIAQQINDLVGESKQLGNLGRAYKKIEQYDEAIHHYKQAIDIAKILNKQKEQGDWLNDLGDIYSKLGKLKLSLSHYQQALSISKVLDDRVKEGDILSNLGNVCQVLGDIDKATEYHHLALLVARELGDQYGESTDLMNLGNAYYLAGDIASSINYYENAVKLNKELARKQKEGITLGNLGNAYRDLGQMEKAIEYYHKALAIARETGDKEHDGTWLGNLGITYYMLEEVGKAIGYYEAALEVGRTANDRKSEAAWLGNLGKAYRELGEFEQAIGCLEQALKIAREIEDKRGEGADLGNLGVVYRDRGDFQSAIDYYQQALTIARETKDIQNEGVWLANLGEAYYQLGNLTVAQEHWGTALVIFQTIQSPQKELMNEWLTATSV